MKEKSASLKAQAETIETRRLERENRDNQSAQSEGALRGEIEEMQRKVEEKARECSAKDDEITRLRETNEETRKKKEELLAATESLEKVVADQKREMWQRAAQMKQVCVEFVGRIRFHFSVLYHSLVCIFEGANELA